MPIYLAPSLPLSCEISYNSFMQISHERVFAQGERGRKAPRTVKPERRNLELYDPPTSPSFFRANISKRAAYRNPEFYVFWRAPGALAPPPSLYIRSYFPLASQGAWRGGTGLRGGARTRAAADVGIISRYNNIRTSDTDNLPILAMLHSYYVAK